MIPSIKAPYKRKGTECNLSPLSFTLSVYQKKTFLNRQNTIFLALCNSAVLQMALAELLQLLQILHDSILNRPSYSLLILFRL